MLPDFFGSVGKNRGHEADEGGQDPEKGGLGRAPLGGGCGGGVEPVLQDVQIQRAQVNRAEVVQGMKDDMELKIDGGFSQPGDQFLQAQQNPAVDLQELRIRNQVFLGVEVIKVSQEE